MTLNDKLGKSSLLCDICALKIKGHTCQKTAMSDFVLCFEMYHAKVEFPKYFLYFLLVFLQQDLFLIYSSKNISKKCFTNCLESYCHTEKTSTELRVWQLMDQVGPPWGKWGKNKCET